TLEYLLTLDPHHPFAQGDLETVASKIRDKRQKGAMEEATFKRQVREAMPAPPKEKASALHRAQQDFYEVEQWKAPQRKKEILDFEKVEGVGDGAHPSMEQIALYYQQQAYQLQHQYDDIEGAIVYYEKAMAIRPSSSAANGLGVLYERKGWYVQAEDAYRQALAVDAFYLAAHTNLALLYDRLGRTEEAFKHWKVRAEAGGSGDYWTQKARAHLEKNLGKW
ncbi:MAG: hypothetical protein ABH845_06935, partial [Candidatus Omnitrophota bacterium]